MRRESHPFGPRKISRTEDAAYVWSCYVPQMSRPHSSCRTNGCRLRVADDFRNKRGRSVDTGQVPLETAAPDSQAARSRGSKHLGWLTDDSASWLRWGLALVIVAATA